ncbi:hypothetical protein [Kamptonema sp. UHCC 0994]|uniref:hypothetical protein n=1 Tax=Kamptonema sp. UHCC 0994 TaxID=3031329 RepID=UPI0023B8E0BA|nr:hypothetical protein [Kamptonema sp. UHCC 0994]MDF0555929.1 hypothetical protein [Kamptonema sp. UHCC 0994]
MSLPKCEADILISYTNAHLVGVVDFKPDSLELIPEMQSKEVGDEEIEPDELTPGTLAILARIETFDEYFHCCGRW